jgi:hypothetical protein
MEEPIHAILIQPLEIVAILIQPEEMLIPIRKQTIFSVKNIIIGGFIYVTIGSIVISTVLLLNLFF